MKNLFEIAAIPAAFIAAMIMMYLVVGVGVNTSQAQTVVDEWSGVKFPPPPELKQVTIKPEITALLLLGFNSQTCNL